ncbi:DUF1295-domain-containing protein [Aaosphaeria arxii CBS 175.79]|uniref:DUF1295-domain-containing protein n=1 Tax=Aaosphaeria arxii CBS 175.79 TaxID=1450172 RepID=A0A6A5Y6A5_9PLEO|nr:DUF1295-domain-containing protein [Aaosphaeria arxii CBS 175.79]KAF2021048.1 DUF1295-domain-containing protein [Aaosphaeria arxii CBS 175.79]
MTLLQTLLRATAFRTPLLRTLVPTVALAYGIQTAVAIPSIAAQTERFYDLSGSLTYLSCTAASLFLPYLRARAAGQFASGGLSEYLAATGAGQGAWWWRQAVLSAAVGVWATRLGTYLFKRISSDGHDSRFDKIRGSASKFYVAFFAQATWVSLCLLPVIAVNSLPRSAFALTASKLATTGSTAAAVVAASPYATDILGLFLFAFGLTFEIVADRQKSQWSKEKKEKKHSEEFLTRGLWSKSRHPNYFGEITLWTGIAVVGAMCAASPAFVSFLLLKVSGVPLSEKKYDGKFGDRKDYKEWKENTPMLIPKF